jgi:D-galactarolactone cycloisomerase
MRITAIECHCIEAPLDVSLTDTNQYRKTQNAVVVEVHTDTGLTGIGESGWFGGPTPTTAFLVEQELAPLLIGEDPRRIERLWQKLYMATYYHGRHGMIMSAISGIDIALWDILGKHLNVPICELLGQMSDSFRAYASAGSYDRTPDPDSLANELAGWVKRGFRGVKMRIGRLPLSEDLERVAAVRKAIGGDVELMVDANGKLAPKEAIRLARALELYNVAWIEEPTYPDNPVASHEVRVNTTIPIAGYELISGVHKFRELIERESVDIVQSDAVWIGGITPLRRIATLAEVWDKPFVPHVHSTAIALAANLQVIASFPNCSHVEIDQENTTMMADLLVNRIDCIDSNSCVAVPKAPGLGIELNREVLERFSVDK